MMLLRGWVRRRCSAIFAPRNWLLQTCRFSARAGARPAQSVDQAKLDGLLDEYDRAPDGGERDRVAEQIYDLVGERVRGMITRANRTGRPLDAELNLLTMQALLRGLQESGMTTLKRNSVQHGDWTEVVLRCQRGDGPAAALVWKHLSPDLRSEIESSPNYVRTTTGDRFVRELNGMARDPRFVEQLMATVAVPDAARALAGKGTGSLSRTEVSQLGAMLIQGAFPDQVTNLVAPERNLLGYISSVVMPRMRPSEIGEAAKAVEVDSMATNRKRKS